VAQAEQVMGHMVANHTVRVEHPILALGHAIHVREFALLDYPLYLEPISANVVSSGVQPAPLFQGACVQGHSPARNIRTEFHEVSA
jgi:hypothetical protein